MTATKETLEYPAITIWLTPVKIVEDWHLQTKTMTSFSLETKYKVHFAATVLERWNEPESAIDLPISVCKQGEHWALEWSAPLEWSSVWLLRQLTRRKEDCPQSLRESRCFPYRYIWIGMARHILLYTSPKLQDSAGFLVCASDTIVNYWCSVVKQVCRLLACIQDVSERHGKWWWKKWLWCEEIATRKVCMYSHFLLHASPLGLHSYLASTTDSCRGGNVAEGQLEGGAF